MRFYDKIETPQSGKTFLVDDVNRIIQTDSRVRSWFESLPNGYSRAYTAEGLPFNELIPLPTDEEILQQSKDIKLIQIEDTYTISITDDIDYMATVFQADEKSQQLIVNVLSAGGVPTDFAWWDKNNIPVPMTYVELQNFSGSILTRGQAAFVHKQELKVSVLVATTQEELDLITWSI